LKTKHLDHLPQIKFQYRAAKGIFINKMSIIDTQYQCILAIFQNLILIENIQTVDPCC